MPPTDDTLQAAIDAALEINGYRHEGSLVTRKADAFWRLEAPARLEVAKTFLAALPPAALPPAAAPALEAMLEACVPGGNTCDPQKVADDIRAWWQANGQPADAPDQAEEIERLREELGKMALEYGHYRKALDARRAELPAAIAAMEAVPANELEVIWDKKKLWHERIELIRSRFIQAAREAAPGEDWQARTEKAEARS